MVSVVRTGTRLSPELVVEHQLGAGAVGSVWRGHHARYGVVAVKVLGNANRTTKELLSRFEREAHAAMGLRSPHLVRVFEFSQKPVPHLVMEHLDGEDLAARLGREGRLGGEQAVRIMIELCLGLSQVHSAGLVHRDIKPSNIFLSQPSSRVTLLDFGMVKELDAFDLELTRSGELLGTPHYASPEQLTSARRIDHYADLWAATVIAYQMIVGDLPYPGRTLTAVLLDASQARFIPPSKLAPDVSPEVDAWFARALNPIRTERFSTAKELALSFSALTRYVPEDSGASSVPPRADTHQTGVRRRAPRRPVNTIRIDENWRTGTGKKR